MICARSVGKINQVQLLPQNSATAHAAYDDGEMPTQPVLQSLNPSPSTIASNPSTVNGKDHPDKTEN